jgi:polysaccharide deacetylase 2 family uncharacterized protein YibQ
LKKKKTKKPDRTKLILIGLVLVIVCMLVAASYMFMASQAGNEPPMEQNFSHEDSIAQVIAPMVAEEGTQTEDTFTLTFEDELPNPTTPATDSKAQEVTKRHVLALIIDDVGYSMQALRRLIALPYPLTLSILPDAPYAKQAAQMAYQHGITVMLHMPMETTNPKYQSKMEDFYLHTTMSQPVFTQVFEDALAKVPHAVGVNNHMGSALTADKKSMQRLMQLSAKHNLFFIDSRTTAKSVAADTAQEAHIPWNARDIFLDNSVEADALTHAWDSAMACVQRNDYCIMLAHPHPETISFLEKMTAENQDITWVDIKEVLTR